MMKMNNPLYVTIFLLVALGTTTTTTASSHLRPQIGPDEFEDFDQGGDMKASTTTDIKGYQSKTEIFRRHLQNSVVINALVDAFVPNLADQVENTVSTTLDPVNVGYTTNDDQGQVQLNLPATWCNASMANSNIQYQLGQMTGLSSMDITKLELAPGTEDINIPLLGFFGAQKATWSGEWMVHADFKRFNAQTKATLSNTFCGFTFEEILEGSSLLSKPTLEARIKLAGETSNIYQFNSNSKLNEAKILEMKFGYNTLTPRLGKFADLVTLDADTPLMEIGQTGLSGDLKDLIQTTVQNAINNQLPYTL